MKLSIAAALGLLALSATEAVKVNPLPKPVDIQWGNSGPIAFDKFFKFTVTNGNKLLEEAARRATEALKENWVPVAWETPMPEWPPFPQLSKRGYNSDSDSDSDDEAPTGSAKINLVRVVAPYKEEPLQLGHDESYTIDVKPNGEATISSKSVWGAMHGLSTFQQLVIYDPKLGRYYIEQPVAIKDAPKFPHRGVMYDTARNFLPVQTLYSQIRALSFSKLNVLHWHMTDSQSWPLEIEIKARNGNATEKALAQDLSRFKQGAYSKKETYTADDVRKVVEYGRQHGVRVFPEIDMPAHSNKGWAAVDPKTITCGDSWWDNDGWTHHSAVQPNPGHLDIMYNGTYKYLKPMYDHVASLFQDNFFHVGFDELIPYCYNYSQPTMEWFEKNPGKTFHDLAQYWVDHTMPIFQDRPDRRIMMWEDSVLSNSMRAKVSDKVVMQTWNNGIANIKALTSQGYDVVVTSADFFYLDCGHGGYVSNDPRYNEQEKPPLDPALAKAVEDYGHGYSLTTQNYGGPGASWCSPYKSWQRIYGYDFLRGLTAEEAKRVIGGEAAMWSETTDATNLDNKVWPRAAALAELLWSGNTHPGTNKKRVTEMSQRIYEFRERLVARGINASPLAPKFCIQNAHHCDFHLDQNAWDKPRPWEKH